MAISEIITVGIVSLSVATVLEPDSTENAFLFITNLGLPFSDVIFSSVQKILLLFAAIILLTSIFNFLVIYKVNSFSQKVCARISTNLFSYFLNQEYVEQNTINNSEKTSRIYSDGLGLMAMVDAFFQLISRVIVILFFTCSLLVINFQASIILIGVLVILYLIISFFANRKFDEGSNTIANMHDDRFSLIKNAFNSVKQLIIFNKRDLFIENFDAKGMNLAFARSQNITFTHTPRFIVESFIFISIILFCIFVLGLDGFESSQYIALLSLYALSGLKLLPAFQGLFFAYASIKVHSKHLTNLEPYLSDIHESKKISKESSQSEITFDDQIIYENVSFSYSNKSEVLSNLNLTIKKKSKIGIVGRSGSGKSTLIDILMGLCEPTSGKIMIDQSNLQKSHIHNWQKNISYVQQEVALIDGSISENILFGDQIENTDDEDKLKSIISATGIKDMLSKNKMTIHDNVGDSGSQLSGGQRQRIAIARALWKDRHVLILDEATSALDNISEEKIIKNILDLYHDKTVIMIAHRLTSLKACDEIITLDNGCISDHGSWSNLIQSSELFNELLKAHDE